ncbi:death-on-curing family protein [Hoeflea sp. IMCC20628]|uniref:type II toxin-antitoxin system death-on-curing family toxin n=1 Tax=Hoeflea sp. IMCC20628 TaxID=1620421 RepID=UPI00063AADAA|nr:type II toxin-antitoxin system death-on-curing family toxin [Hoeflea sp. IMCC20628]AKI03175.1 death-on-curing family protein [Hoeflea sp. IMCC20628]
MRYVTLQEALHIHAVLFKVYGGAAGIHDRGLIAAALLRPQTGYYTDLMEEASALWESLAMNQGFVDGNKRVAFACIFLDLNGFELTAGEEETIKFICGRLESGSFTKDTLDAWLRANTAPS